MSFFADPGRNLAEISSKNIRLAKEKNLSTTLLDIVNNLVHRIYS